jgi:hypothetical protein
MRNHILSLIAVGFIALSACVDFDHYEDQRHNVKPSENANAALLLEKLEKYRTARESELTTEYRMSEDFGNYLPTVKLLPIDEPQFTADGRKVHIEYAKIVHDEYNRRIPALEKGRIPVTAELRGFQLKRERQLINIDLPERKEMR